MLDNTNAFFASHDYSRRFTGANIHIFSIPTPKKDKVLRNNSENQQNKLQKASRAGWQISLIMSGNYIFCRLLQATTTIPMYMDGDTRRSMLRCFFSVRFSSGKRVGI